jgi:serine/threonine protein kinase
MAVSIPEFWNLAIESQLLTSEQCQQLGVGFGQVRGAAMQGTARTLAEWLISRGVLTRYQTTILLAGRSGPFFYGDYKLVDRAETGPLAGMFRAVHTATQHAVALQFLTGPATQDPQQWTALAAQLHAHCGVKHPHLQRCFEVVDLSTYRFVVLEDLPAQGADQLLLGGKRLPAEDACRIVRCAALGLVQLHQRNLACGDIRPQRIGLEKGGNVRLAREPMIAFTPVYVSQSDAGANLAARADYLAPEFLQAGKLPDPLTDIYAVGCTLYELLTGGPPFPGGHLGQKMHQHASQPIQPLEPFGVPPALAQAVAYMMAKNPSVRYQNINQVIGQLSAFVDAARASVQSPAAPATLAAYERAIQQRQSASPVSVAPQLGSIGRIGTPIAVSTPAVTPLASVGAVVSTNRSLRPTATASASAVHAARSRTTGLQKDLLMRIGLGAGLTLGLLVILLIWVSIGNGPPAEEHPSAVTLPNLPPPTGSSADDAIVPPAKAAPAELKEPAVSEAPSDISPPWKSPTAGDPVSLQYAPPGSQVYLIFRPADLVNHAEGPRVLQALGPVFSSHRTAWESAAGVSWNEVEQLIVSLHDPGGPLPTPTFVVRLKTPLDRAELLKRWRNPSPATHGAAEYFAAAVAAAGAGGGGTCYLVPSGNSEQSVFVMGPEADIREVIDAQGAPPLLPLAMEKLLKVSDAERHFTAVFAPNELISNVFRDGRPWTFCSPRRIREPLDWFLGDVVEAGLCSIHLGDPAYVEVVLAGRAARQKDELPNRLRDQLRQIPQLVERFVAGVNAPPDWKAVADRYPQMVRDLSDHARIATRGDLTIVKVEVAAAAAQDLVLGTERSLASRSTLPKGNE